MNNNPKKTRANRVRKKLRAISQFPRLSVFRSNSHIWAQIIDDAQGKTIASYSDKDIKSGTKTEKASQVGQAIAKLALDANIKQVVFDRGSYKFHGRVKALAEAARLEGLKI